MVWPRRLSKPQQLSKGGWEPGPSRGSQQTSPPWRSKSGTWLRGCFLAGGLGARGEMGRFEPQPIPSQDGAMDLRAVVGDSTGGAFSARSRIGWAASPDGTDETNGTDGADFSDDSEDVSGWEA